MPAVRNITHGFGEVRVFVTSGWSQQEETQVKNNLEGVSACTICMSHCIFHSSIFFNIHLVPSCVALQLLRVLPSSQLGADLVSLLVRSQVLY